LAGSHEVSNFLQATVNGLLLGGIYALVAIGFSLVWGVMNVINLAHGALVVLGAYLVWELNAGLHIDPLVGVVPVAIVMFALGYALQRGLINLIVNAPVFLTLLLTFGINLLLVNGMDLVFSADLRGITTSYAQRSLDVGSLRIAQGRLYAFLVAVALTLALVWLLHRTRIGIAIRATGMDRGAARLMGIKARHVYAVTFGISAALAGVAGGMSGMVLSFQPGTTPQTWTLYAFLITVVGGLGNMYGALAGGVLLGLVGQWGSLFMSSTLVEVLVFTTGVFVLAARPAGLLGRSFYASRVEV
jgi:branched-chain amino acid transport system permease protein